MKEKAGPGCRHAVTAKPSNVTKPVHKGNSGSAAQFWSVGVVNLRTDHMHDTVVKQCQAI